MNNTQVNKKEIVENFLNNVPEEIEFFVKHSMDIVADIATYLEKNQLSQKQFAALLGKEESEISKWLSGNHNFTLKSLSKIESVIDLQLIFTRLEIAKRFLPYIFRQIKTAHSEEQFHQLIHYYCLSEHINQDVTFLLSQENFSNTLDKQKISNPNEWLTIFLNNSSDTNETVSGTTFSSVA